MREEEWRRAVRLQELRAIQQEIEADLKRIKRRRERARALKDALMVVGSIVVVWAVVTAIIIAWQLHGAKQI